MVNFEEVRKALEEALRAGYREQIDLVGAVDATYEFLEACAEDLSDDQVLTLRVMLAQAETQLGRYFGM
ncbi:MAG: hypothetical protein FJZ01_01515 [Candidatus Sericytochromatia bacterium]|nr:hypothetical protein [Candidatus Tanganyikabacteria bacterium]